jgi:hypothetical protein
MDIQKVPVEWRSHRRAWMMSQIMEEWLTACNGRWQKENTKLACFVVSG